ncbi:MAG: carboxypeptidase regulatory-like domain-containing protein [Acidobacteria bacterium]|nr:carboxypeptidase regulatory-like domain-containing protein [Acidobacteriota bacterium]
METSSRTRRWAVLALSVLLALPQAGLVLAQGETAKSEPKAEIRGTVRDQNGATVTGARLVLSPLETPERSLSATTDEKGQYTLRAVQRGYYSVAVDFAGKAYVGNRTVLVQPARDLRADFQLGPFLPEDAFLGLKEGEPVASLGQPAAGVARLHERSANAGLAWLRTGKGVAVLIGGGVLAVGALIALAGDDDEPSRPASPSNP